MANIPIRFKRMAAAFDEAARRQQPCDGSSGSEYWPESGTDLSDLVNSFLEDGGGSDDQLDISLNVSKDDVNKATDNCDANWVSDNDNEKDDNDDDDKERKEMLKGLLLECGVNNCGVKQKIYDEIEVWFKSIRDYSDSSTTRNVLKRGLMAHLRDKGFDAGLCKSRWEKTGRITSGSYEYIDVKVGQIRYIVEIFLTGELEIARPTARYTAFLGMIPPILVIEKPQVLKQLMRLMSAAMKKSLKHVDMHVPPWRRTAYLEAKYFSPFKRTTNREPGSETGKGERGGPAKKRYMIGFKEVLVRVTTYSSCRGDDFVSKGGGRVGLLAAALQGK